MKVSQIQTIVNGLRDQFIGKTDVANVDLTNLVDFGTELFDAASTDAVTGALVDHIGRMIFVDRKYAGFGANLLKDGWEFGAVLQKVRTQLKDAVKNESWDLQDGKSYDPNVYVKPFVANKFFSRKVTFEVDLSITDYQLKSAFTTAEQFNAFASMLFDGVDKTLTIAVSDLARATVSTLIAETLYNQYPDPANTTPYSAASGVRAVNLLKEYNDMAGTTLTVGKCMSDKEFLRFASKYMGDYVHMLGDMSVLFNLGGTEKFTPVDRLHVMLLGQFESAAKFYLSSDTFHNDLVALPLHETVDSWQGIGQSKSFASLSSINVKNDTHTVAASGIIGVMFDHDAAMICNQERRVKTNYNPKAEFTNYFYKQDASYFVDTDENCVVFFVA